MADRRVLSTEIQSQWARIRGRLRAEFGDAAYRSWLMQMTLMDVNGGRVRVAVPTRFLRDWIAAHYADRIRALWNGENSSIVAVEVSVGAAAQPPAESPAPTAETAGRNGRPMPGETVSDEKAEVGAPLDPRFTFENFIVG